MDEALTSSSDGEIRPSAFPLARLVVLLAITGLLAFILATPRGLLNKADMVGYAVCHRIESHSFTIAGRQLPLCARCTGTFVGALVGFFGQAVVLRRRRAGQFPPAHVIAVLVIFMAVWAADGLNSYMALMHGPHLYEPQNWLRLSTGALNGLTMSALVYPVFGYTLWRDSVPQPAIRSLRDLGVLVCVEAAIVGLVLTQWAFLIYPLSLLSAAGVLALLTSVNSMLVLMIVQRENVANNWREAIVPLLAGFTVSLIQVGVIDIVRYAFTGTLSGLPPLQ